MSSDRPLSKLSELLIRQLNQGLSDEQYDVLKDWLTNNTEARQYYVEFMAMHAYLRKKSVASVVSEPLNLDLSEANRDETETSLGLPGEVDQGSKARASESPPEHVDEIRRIAEQRLSDFLSEQEEARRQQAVYQAQEATTHFNKEGIYSAASRLLRNALRLAALATIVLVVLAVIQFALRQRIVATLDEGVHARWDQPPTDPNLRPGPMILREGFAKLTFKQGAEIVLQAPCAFDLSSKNKMVLHRGMLTAQVPDQAHGFAIKTPQSVVIDFGTEFGVQVQESAASEVHVFDGRVQVRTTGRAQQPGQKRDVTKGRAAVLTQHGELDISGMNTRPNLFTRGMPHANTFSIPNKRMDLADIVGGGNGFGTGHRFACINPVTGQTAPMYRSQPRTGVAEYVRVPSLPFVDGVFVPLAEGGLMPVSTAGHHFDFPPGAGSWYVELANGVEATGPESPQPHGPLTLDGQNYGTVAHPALIMHANAGITFDLDVIRNSLIGSYIKRFTSVCGISNSVQKTKTPDAILYVLVDGQVRFYKKIALPADPAIHVKVELRENERYLTLVCMAGTKNLGDWTFFGDPALELEE